MNDATSVRSYSPGAWFAIFGDHATVVLPPSEKARVAELWQLVDGGAGFDEVLDKLISSGLRELPGFVLVGECEADTKVVIRGPGRARFTTASETVELEGSSAATWVERSLTGVTGMTIDVAEDGAEGAALTIENGLVRIGRVETPPPAREVAEVAREVAKVAGGVADDSSHAEPTAPTPVPEPTPDPDPDPAASGPETPTPPVPNPSPVAEPSAIDHDGLTHAGGWDTGQLARQQPGIPGQPPAPSVVARPVAKLVLSSGETVELDRTILVGRAPETRRFPSPEQPRLVTVPSPHQEISSTHLELRPGSGVDHGTAVVTDLGSTNGTVLVQPGLPPEDLQPGATVQLIPGAIIDLGDGVTIQVTNP